MNIYLYRFHIVNDSLKHNMHENRLSILIKYDINMNYVYLTARICDMCNAC